jgi:hypothetical protein
MADGNLPGDTPVTSLAVTNRVAKQRDPCEPVEFPASDKTVRYVLEREICAHGIRKYDCRICKGRGICEHDRCRRKCVRCGNPVSRRCPHGRKKYDCIECNGRGICPHKRRRRRCRECNTMAGRSIKRKRRQCLKVFRAKRAQCEHGNVSTNIRRPCTCSSIGSSYVQ